MSNFTHAFTRVSFRIDVRSEVADLYHGGLKTPSPSLLDVPTTDAGTGCTTWGDLFHPTAASVLKIQSGTGTLSYPKVTVPLEQLGSYRFVEDLFGELKAHFPKKVLQRCTQDGPALLQLPFLRHGEKKAASGAAEEEDADNIKGLVSTVDSSVKATQSSTFAIPIEVSHLPPHILHAPSSSSPSSSSTGEGSVVSLRVTVLDTRLATSLSTALNNYQFIALEVGRLVKLTDPIASAMRKFEVSRRAVAGEAVEDEDDEHLASSRKEGDTQPNTTHFNIDDDLWGMLREDPTTAGAENKEKCFVPGNASEFDFGAHQVIGSKRTVRSNEHPTSVTEAVLYQQLDDDTNRKDMDLDAQHLQLQQQRAAAHSEHPPPGKSFPLGQVNTLYQLAVWIETHVEFVGVLSASGENASSFAFAMKRLIQLKTTVPQLLELLEDEQASETSSSTPTKLPFSFANHTCHYVRAVALMYGRYVLPLEEFLLLVIPQTKDVGGGGGGRGGVQDELLSCSPDGSTVMTVRELCEALLLKDEVCEAFTPLYEYEVLRSIKGRVLRLSADVRQRERDLEELAKRRKAQQEAALQSKVHRGGVVGGKGASAKNGQGGGGGGEGRGLQATGSLSAAGFTSMKELSDFLRREARLANAREAHVVGFEDGELDIESDGEEADKTDASKGGGGDVFNLASSHAAAAAQKAKATVSSASAMDKDALAKAKKQQEATRLKARAAAMKSTLSFTSSFSAQAQSVLMPLLGLSEPQRADDPMYLQFSSPYFSVSDRNTL